MNIIEPHLTDSYNLLRKETRIIRLQKNILSYAVPVIFSGTAVIGTFLTDRTLAFFIFVLIPITIFSLIAGITIANFLQYGQKRLMPGFNLFLEWKTAKGLLRDAGIREPIDCAFPGYICSAATMGVEYAYTCITVSNIYILWFASRNRQMHMIKLPKTPELLRPCIKNPVLNLMFIHSYMIKYGNITFISEHASQLMSNINRSAANTIFNSDFRQFANN